MIMKLHKAFWILPLLPLGILWSCSTPPRVQSGNTDPSRQSEPVFPPEYSLGFGDVVEIKFFNNERFNETVAVRPDGRITLEKMGDIPVIGMTPLQLDSLITVTYAEFVRSPEVTVFVRQFGSYQVYVLGEVNLPGGYPIQQNMTIMQAVAVAGGAKETAKLGCVMILRRGEGESVNAVKVDLASVIKGANGVISLDDFYVQGQDVIYVPKTFIASASAFLKQVYDGLLPPVDIYLRAAWLTHR